MSEMKELLARLVGAPNRQIREEITRQILSGEVLISDLHASLELGGAFVLMELGEEDNQRSRDGNPRMYWIKVLCNKFGDPVKPGDIVSEQWDKMKFRSDGTAVPPEEIAMDRINGDYDAKWTRTTEHVVDAAGCIRLPFSLAALYIATFGVHWKTGHRVCRTLNRESYEPVDDGTGNKRRLINWRYSDIPEAEHQRLIDAATRPAVAPVVVDVDESAEETETETAKPKRTRRTRKVKKDDTSKA
jgi:hypothetical protein